LENLKNIWKKLGSKMSEFHSGKHKNIIFETRPLSQKRKRKPKFLWHLPYWTAQRVFFQITIDLTNEKKLIHDIPIFFNRANSSFEADRLEEGENCILSEDGKEVLIITEGLRGSSILEYYLGSPNAKGATTVVELQGNWRDKKWFIVYGLLGGFIGSFILFILGLLSRAISVCPQSFRTVSNGDF
jgi:hypothetical protein